MCDLGVSLTPSGVSWRRAGLTSPGGRRPGGGWAPWVARGWCVRALCPAAGGEEEAWVESALRPLPPARSAACPAASQLSRGPAQRGHLPGPGRLRAHLCPPGLPLAPGTAGARQVAPQQGSASGYRPVLARPQGWAGVPSALRVEAAAPEGDASSVTIARYFYTLTHFAGS